MRANSHCCLPDRSGSYRWRIGNAGGEQKRKGVIMLSIFGIVIGWVQLSGLNLQIFLLLLSSSPLSSLRRQPCVRLRPQITIRRTVSNDPWIDVVFNPWLLLLKTCTKYF